ncbi:MAG: undecaprenyl/decaprenyl-phosphate alpha-N-acetylglucosaminyl 1-phosphate transferase, partial [Cyanobacteria bacterium J06638_6]
MPFVFYHVLAFGISAAVVLCTTPIVRRIGLKSGRV